MTLVSTLIRIYNPDATPTFVGKSVECNSADTYYIGEQLLTLDDLVTNLRG